MYMYIIDHDINILQHSIMYKFWLPGNFMLLEMYMGTG